MSLKRPNDDFHLSWDELVEKYGSKKTENNNCNSTETNNCNDCYDKRELEYAKESKEETIRAIAFLIAFFISIYLSSKENSFLTTQIHWLNVILEVLSAAILIVAGTYIIGSLLSLVFDFISQKIDDDIILRQAFYEREEQSKNKKRRRYIMDYQSWMIWLGILYLIYVVFCAIKQK